MSSPDFRALCAELVKAWCMGADVSGPMNRARAALAQPVAEELPPRVGHILRLADIIREVDGSHNLGAAALAEAILSHPESCWRPAQPVAEGTDEELLRTYGEAKRAHSYDGPLDDWPRRAERAATVCGLRAVLARWGRPTPQPIPVSERLPERADCALWPGEPDSDPWCWAGRDIDGGWEWTQLGVSHFSSDLGRVMRGQGYSHWAPHWAFPLPGAPAAEDVQP